MEPDKDTTHEVKESSSSDVGLYEDTDPRETGAQDISQPLNTDPESGQTCVEDSSLTDGSSVSPEFRVQTPEASGSSGSPAGIQSGASPFSAVAVLQVSVVLQDCVDQLAIVGNIISYTHRDPSAAVKAVSEDISLIQKQQKIAASRGQVKSMSKAVKERDAVLRSLRASQFDHLMAEDMVKVQCDGKYASRKLTEIMKELNEEASFNCLINILQEAKRTKDEMTNISTRDKQDLLRIKTLKEQLHNIQKETKKQIQERERTLAELEDRLRKLRIKRNQNQKQVKTSMELLVYQGQKWNRQMERQLEDNIQVLKEKLVEEENFHKEMKSFLERSHTRLKEDLNYWMKRYEQDTEDMQNQLNNAKTTKANNQETFKKQSQKLKDCEQVISEDRLEKENLRKQLENEELQRKAAVKVQSWWRGMLVRKGLGPFRKGKKPKQKKEGKKGKKKKK